MVKMMVKKIMSILRSKVFVFILTYVNSQTVQTLRLYPTSVSFVCLDKKVFKERKRMYIVTCENLMNKLDHSNCIVSNCMGNLSIKKGFTLFLLVATFVVC